LQRLEWGGGEPVGPPALVEAATRQLDEYFAGRRRTFELPLDLVGTEFQRRAWLALAEIPYGETRTYAEQARRLRSGARAVGSANASNPLPIVIPCHRLVGTNGSLTGYAGGLDHKGWLLRLEGALR
jgi:methylated-DNA-[protein]-cysteine S-methyltransferase